MAKKIFKRFFSTLGFVAIVISVALGVLYFNLNTKYTDTLAKVEAYELAALPTIGGKSFNSSSEYIEFLTSDNFCQGYKIKLDYEVKLHYMLEPDTEEDKLPNAGDYSNAVYEISNVEKFSETDCKIYFAIPYKTIGGEEFNSTRIVYVSLSELTGGLSGSTFSMPKATFINLNNSTK